MDNQQKQQTVDRIKQANNILVTVSSNPSVDQLAACIGLTLALNKMNKHATAVFSGEVPSTIEFLEPEKTIEKTTDSLRDFIIALDKSKADKLRYKVEDQVVKIFITPYRTSISDKDLQFSQGDFNVDVVIAVGVHSQTELDQAITSHGRILHDATVITLNVQEGGELGAINWLDNRSSSLSELIVQLVDAADKKLFDTQIATALLTGIVAETERFSNDKTSPLTMSYAAELMTAGANQQLVATKLAEKPKPAPAPEPEPLPEPETKVEAPTEAPEPAPEPPKEEPDDSGVLEVDHGPEVATNAQQLVADEDDADKPISQIKIDREGNLSQSEQEARAEAQAAAEKQAADAGSVDPTSHLSSGRKILPNVGGDNKINAVGTSEESYNPLTGPTGAPTGGVPQILTRPGASTEQTAQPDLPQAQANVAQAAGAQEANEPTQGLNANPMTYELHGDTPGQLPQPGTLPPPPSPPPMMPPNQ